MYKFIKLLVALVERDQWADQGGKGVIETKASIAKIILF